MQIKPAIKDLLVEASDGHLMKNTSLLKKRNTLMLLNEHLPQCLTHAEGAIVLQVFWATGTCQGTVYSEDRIAPIQRLEARQTRVYRLRILSTS